MEWREFQAERRAHQSDAQRRLTTDLQPLNTGTISGHEECGDKSHMLRAKEWEAGVWSFSSLAMKGTAGQGGRVRGLSFWIRKPALRLGETD